MTKKFLAVTLVLVLADGLAAVVAKKVMPLVRGLIGREKVMIRG